MMQSRKQLLDPELSAAKSLQPILPPLDTEQGYGTLVQARKGAKDLCHSLDYGFLARHTIGMDLWDEAKLNSILQPLL
jgi:hypothetical protein